MGSIRQTRGKQVRKGMSMAESDDLVVQFDKVVGRFRFTPSSGFKQHQEELFDNFESELLVQARERVIGRPLLEFATQADRNDPESVMAIDVKNEPLLFNISARDVAFLLSKSSELDMLATYSLSLLRAMQRTLGMRDLVSFEVMARQVVHLTGRKNFNVIERLLPGITKGRDIFECLPKDPVRGDYQIQRADCKWTVLCGDMEYIYDVQGPANDEWSQLWFSFMARTPEEESRPPIELTQDVRSAIRHCLRGQRFLRSLLGETSGAFT